MSRLLLLLGRAVRLRCPRCGARGLFTAWLQPRAHLSELRSTDRAA